MSDYRPVFLIGAARSGTKLVRDLVAQHPSVDRVAYDINYVWRLGNEKVPHDELIPEWLTPEIEERILRRFDALHVKAPVMIEKTVSNCLRVPYVQAIFPGAQFVHLVRDGVDVVESAHRQWQAPTKWGYVLKKTLSFPLMEALGYGFSYGSTLVRKLVARDRGSIGTWGPRYAGIDEDLARLDLLTVCTIQWVRSVETALNDWKAVPAERVLTLRYEDLVREPRRHLELVAQFLSVEPSFFRHLHLGFVSQDSIRRGYRELSPVQLGQVLAYSRDTLRRLGYERIPAANAQI